MHDIHHGVKFFVEQIKQRLPVPPKRVLVAGCGSQGKEVPALAQLLATSEVVGFDINLRPELHGTQGENWQLLTGDVLNIPFESQSFDTVFYYHVIEHVPDPARSLAEIARVLQPKGTLFIGTPNRGRLVGYIGSQSTWKEKLLWNWNDYKYRLRGKFRNEYGAHAGYTEKELLQLMEPYFTDIIWLTKEYLLSKYAGRLPNPLLTLLVWRPVRLVIAPAVYAWATKAQ